MVLESPLLLGAHSIPHLRLSQPQAEAHQNCSSAGHVPGPSSSWVPGEGMQAWGRQGHLAKARAAGNRLGHAALSQGHQGRGGTGKGNKWMKRP